MPKNILVMKIETEILCLFSCAELVFSVRASARGVSLRANFLVHGTSAVLKNYLKQ